ncbi:MAG: YggS family pyridoxal phosphate-dependent enzyme [Nitrospinae bacterium]|nr:YggS family pyridoxal phosphate-dependent enzyme [Nitrospinota bacterium]
MHDDNDLRARVAANLADVRANIASAARRAGRAEEEITLVAVTKTVGANAVRAAIDCGIKVIGESRVQEAQEKFRALGGLGGAEWHFIGPLQKNKVKYLFDMFSMVHSVDSFDLAAEIGKRAAGRGAVMPILLEVNIGEEGSKHGVPPLDAEEAARQIAGLAGVRLAGLMAIPPFTDDPEASRPHFRRLMDIRHGLERLKLENASFNVLSFGMTGDYAVAIEEGATHVRIGTGIFGERKT